ALRPRSPSAMTTALMWKVEWAGGGILPDARRHDCEPVNFSPVISRTLRCHVRYAHAHSLITASRLRKPMSQKMWRKSQNTHQKNPEASPPPMTDTADPRPITAIVP